MAATNPPLPLRNKATELLHQVFGFSDFRGEQADIIEHLSQGGDALVLMPTGGGKSLCYQLPALLRQGTGIIVSPLIALMQDQVDRLATQGIRAALINATIPNELARATVQQAFRGELDLLYVAPERLVNDFFLAILDGLYEAGKIALFAIDEAHCISHWGHDFRPEYRQLGLLHSRFPDVPRIALTATADPQTQSEIRDQLDLHRARTFASSFLRPNLRYTLTEKQNGHAQLQAFLARHPGETGIIYCSSRKKVDELAGQLVAAGYPALPYHAGLDAETRRQALQKFRHTPSLIMVATIAFGMGIDRPDVRFVAHLDLPRNLEAYYQETGRAGRDGLPSEAWLAYGLHDIFALHRRLAGTDERGVASLQTLLAYCESPACRQVTLMQHFGERVSPCGHCDNCLQPPALWDATIAAQKALSAVYRTGMQFGVQYLIDVLQGKSNPRILACRHEQLPTFGVGQEYSLSGWRRIFRQLLATGYLAFDLEGKGALRLTEKARPVLGGQERVWLKDMENSRSPK